MADIYDIDFSFQNKQIISPDKRKDKILDLTDAFTDALQDLRDLIFSDYKTGSSYSTYSAATAYVIYDRVTWDDGSVYELQVATSTGVDPTGEALSATNWRKVLEYTVGSDERSAFNAQHIILAYAANKWFGITATPFIYIETLQATGVAFNLHFPIAVYTALGSSNPNRSQRIAEFISKFVPAGLQYSIVTY